MNLKKCNCFLHHSFFSDWLCIYSETNLNDYVCVVAWHYILKQKFLIYLKSYKKNSDFFEII